MARYTCRIVNGGRERMHANDDEHAISLAEAWALGDPLDRHKLEDVILIRVWRGWSNEPDAADPIGVIEFPVRVRE